MNTMLRVQDVMEILQIEKPTAYKTIKQLNNELEEQGFYTISGRIPKDYLFKRYNLK